MSDDRIENTTAPWAVAHMPPLTAHLTSAQLREHNRQQDLFAATTPVNPASDAGQPVGESWPKDTLHDAARQIVRGAKDLVPAARQGLRDAMDKASAPPTGRQAQDGALGRALGRRHGPLGLRVGSSL